MDTQTPLVLEGISLPDFMQYILKPHAAPTTLIICSTKEAFLQQLHESLAADSNQEGNAGKQQSWTTPTLRLLASSRTVKVVFCPEVPHLRAYLAAYAHRASNEHDEEIRQSTSPRTLAILNPIQLHRPTSAFSAQGLNRTFAAAVEAAHHTKSRLIIAECPGQTQTASNEDLAMDSEMDPPSAPRPSSNPWEDEVSLLNVTTKSFGAGERGWVGRTVQVRTVAERWCRFRDIGAGGD